MLGWHFANRPSVRGGLLLASIAIAGCSSDDSSEEAGSGGATASGSGGMSAGTAASTTGGTSAGVASGGTQSAGTGGGATASGGSSAPTGGTAPAPPNCGDIDCSGDQICVHLSSVFGGEDSDECREPPDGCASWMVCDCPYSAEWLGGAMTGCIASIPPTLYITSASCNGALCDAGMVCLVDDSGAAPASCVDLPAGCTVDDAFCDGDCPTQIAEAAGMEYAGCGRVGDNAGVIVRPP